MKEIILKILNDPFYHHFITENYVLMLPATLFKFAPGIVFAFVLLGLICKFLKSLLNIKIKKSPGYIATFLFEMLVEDEVKKIISEITKKQR